MGKARDEAGNIWETDAQGNPVRLIQPAGASQMPTDPTFPHAGPKAAADAVNAGVNAEVNKATLPYQVRSAAAGASKAEIDAAVAAEEAARKRAEWNASFNPDGTPKQKPADLDPMKLSQFRALEEQIKRVEELFEAGPGSTSGLRAIADYLPSDANSAFDSAAAGLGEVGMAAFRVPGMGSQSDTELKQFVLANTPSASDRDAAIKEKLGNLRRRLEATQQELGIGGTVWEQNRIGGGSAPGAAGYDAKTTIDQLPPEMQAEHAAFLQQWMGNPDPQAYVAFRTELDRKHGYVGDPAEYLAGGQKMAEAIRTGGATIDPNIPGVERKMSGFEQYRNDIASDPVGAAAIGAADMGGLGMVSRLAPDATAASAQLNPWPTAIGQIGGAITGTSLIARAGREATKYAARHMPRASGLLGGGGRAQFGRNVATDAAYGGGYGGVTGQDPLETAAWGAGGSALGQGAGKVLGGAIGGVSTSAPVEALRARGIPMTVPQQIGGMVKAVEDRAMSMPIIGDMIAARRMEGLEAFNREALGEAGGPIGFRPTAIGREGIDQMQHAVGNAYDSATQGANVPLDGAFIADMGRFGQAAQALPRDLRVRAAQAIENRVTPISDAGAMTGEQYQQAVRGLKGYKAEVTKPGFEQDYRDALTMAQDALTEQMRRGGGASVVEGLDNANAAYRGIRTVEDAAMRADGAGYMFTPSQLQDALKKTQRKYPGQSPLTALADQGQEVLPSRIPDSGTAGRAAQMLTGGSLVGAGAGAGAIAGGGEGAQDGALASALATLALMAGGTRTGQRFLTGAIIKRPDELRRAGRAIGNRSGLFGSAMLPFTVSDY